jgi:hypothetical protein
VRPVPAGASASPAGVRTRPRLQRPQVRPAAEPGSLGCPCCLCLCWCVRGRNGGCCQPQQLLDHPCTCPPALPAPRYCLDTAGTLSATPSWKSWAGRSAPPGRWASGRLWTGISRMPQPTGTAVSEWARGGKPASVARICAGCRPAPLLTVTALLLTRCCCWCCPATTLTLPCRSVCGGSAGGAPPCSASTAGGSTGLGLVEPPLRCPGSHSAHATN